MTKTQRFEIFKRDSFTCQYCGSRPPDVVLEVDHIYPRARGGDSDELNLVTSCYECNRGKRDRLLGERVIRPDADLEFLRVQQEVAEAKRYLEAKRVLKEARESIVESLKETWKEYMDDGVPKTSWKTTYVPSDTTFRKWLAVFPPEKVEEAIRIGSNHLYRIKESRGSMVAYVSGILWNIKKLEENQTCPAPEVLSQDSSKTKS